MTLSIVARCSKTGNIGICTTTVNPAVGNRVPHIESNIGAICTQGYTKISYGIKGLKLLNLGLSPQTTLNSLLTEDPDRDLRQVAIIDRHNRTAAFTGNECPEIRGHIIGDCSVVIGNKLSSIQILNQVNKKFRDSKGNLGNRLLTAIEAGLNIDRTKNEKTSAALLVAEPKQFEKPLYINLRVDYHKDPINELRKIFESYSRIYRLI
jgi:uncharacterized Ntn-hydrolase superfamily protein